MRTTFCSTSVMEMRRNAKARKIRGDHRELIHIDRWRLMTPETMIGDRILGRLGKAIGNGPAGAEGLGIPP